MGILANGFRDNHGTFKIYGATASNLAYPSATLANFARTGANRNITAGQGIQTTLSGVPNGHKHPSAWIMPMKSGAMSSRNQAVITFTATGNAAQGINLSGTASIEFSVLGSAAAVAAAIGTATITFTTSGNAVAPLSAVGESTITFTSAGTLSAPATIAGSTTITFTSAAETGAIGHMVAEPIDQTLTPDTIASSVWSASAAGNNAAGSMGEKLNDAGSASNPWTEVIESGYTAGQILKIIAAYAAGSATGLDGSAEFTGLDGTTVRIEGTVSGSTRTITAIDAT